MQLNHSFDFLIAQSLSSVFSAKKVPLCPLPVFFFPRKSALVSLFSVFPQKRCPPGPQAPFWGVVRIWTPFSDKTSQNPDVLHGLGAGEGAGPDEADEADEPDEAEMMHSRQFRP